jgi:hypothetical protein
VYLMYVDESGDPGMTAASPTPVFLLSGIAVHELTWRRYLDQLLDFRRRMKRIYGLRMREEIHASHFLTRPGTLVHIPLPQRVAIMRAFATELAGMTELSVINVIITKAGKAAGFDAFDWGWRMLLQRLENAISNGNLHGPVNTDQRAAVFPDDTSRLRLTRILRKMRRFNPIPSKGGGTPRNLPVKMILEDPNFRNSADSYFVQAADLIAFLLYQREHPSARAKRHGVDKYFRRLSPILYPHAAPADPDGIVRL